MNANEMKTRKYKNMVSGFCAVAAYIKAHARNLRIEGIYARALNTAFARANAACDPTHQRHLELFVNARDLPAAKNYLEEIGLPKAADTMGNQN